jgi:hypothetical protein
MLTLSRLMKNGSASLSREKSSSPRMSLSILPAGVFGAGVQEIPPAVWIKPFLVFFISLIGV